MKKYGRNINYNDKKQFININITTPILVCVDHENSDIKEWSF